MQIFHLLALLIDVTGSLTFINSQGEFFVLAVYVISFKVFHSTLLVLFAFCSLNLLYSTFSFFKKAVLYILYLLYVFYSISLLGSFFTFCKDYLGFLDISK